MTGAHKGKCIDVVHFLCGQGLCGRILNYKEAAVVGFVQSFGPEGVCVSVLDREAERVGALVSLYSLEVRETDRIEDAVFIPGLINGAVYVGDVADVQARGQGIGDLGNAVLAHSVGDEVGAGIEQDRPPDFIGPVVIVAEPSQARLYAADDDRCVFVGPADQVAVDNDGVIGPFSYGAAG